MFDSRHLEALLAVVAEGGFERAAERLHLSQSAVSQRIRNLEEQLGALVLVRTSPVQPTEVGRRLLAHARLVAHLEDDLRQGLVGPGMAGSGEAEAPFRELAVGVNADSLATWFLPALVAVCAAERVLVRLVKADQEQTLELLRRGEVAGCVCTRAEPLQGCRSRYLGRMAYQCLAAPGFAAQWFPQGLTCEAAARAPAVLFNRDDGLHASFLGLELGMAEPSFPHHHIPSSEGFVQAVAQGVAYGMVPALQAAPHLARGELVDLAPGRSLEVPLYWQHWNLSGGLLERVSRILVDHAVTALGAG